MLGNLVLRQDMVQSQGIGEKISVSLVCDEGPSCRVVYHVNEVNHACRKAIAGRAGHLVKGVRSTREDIMRQRMNDLISVGALLTLPAQ